MTSSSLDSRGSKRPSAALRETDASGDREKSVVLARLVPEPWSRVSRSATIDDPPTDEYPTMPAITFHLPDWIDEVVDRERPYRTDEERIGLAIELARQNVLRDTGGPFGAAVFESDSGRLVAAGVNVVTPQEISVLHAEITALIAAHKARRSHSLRAPGLPDHDLATSCAPCAMCLGATLWSGVRRLLIAASRDDAMDLGFDEGPVFPQSYEYLEERGVRIVPDLRREDARAVFELYRA